MSIIRTYLTTSEVKRLSQRDNDYLKGKLEVKCALDNLLQKHINRPLLAELRCILDRKPIPRRKTEQQVVNGKVRVYNAEGALIRIEHCNGRVQRYSI